MRPEMTDDGVPLLPVQVWAELVAVGAKSTTFKTLASDVASAPYQWEGIMDAVRLGTCGFTFCGADMPQGAATHVFLNPEPSSGPPSCCSLGTQPRDQTWPSLPALHSLALPLAGLTPDFALHCSW